MDPIPILIKALVPTIPRDDGELQELAEDLRVMGCEGLLAKPWNLRSEYTLREYKYERGNHWDHTKRRDPDNWTTDVWNRVYGFPRGILGDGQVAATDYSPENSEAMQIQRKASTQGTARTGGREECWSFFYPS